MKTTTQTHNSGAREEGMGRGAASSGLPAIVVTCAACYSLMLLLMLTGNQVVCAALCLVLAVFGWRALAMVRPNVFLVMPVVGWIVFFAVKFVLSYLVGIVVGPYQIGRGTPWCSPSRASWQSPGTSLTRFTSYTPDHARVT